MKTIIPIFLIIFIFNFQNKKTDIYFLYDGDIQNIKLNKNIIIEKQDFNIIDNKGEEVKFKNIKSNLYTFNNFIIKNKKYKFPDYYKKYNIYAYIPIDKNNGYRVKVEKIWKINESIK